MFIKVKVIMYILTKKMFFNSFVVKKLDKKVLKAYLCLLLVMNYNYLFLLKLNLHSKLLV